MLTAPWVWVAVFNGALQLSEGEAPEVRTRALRAASWLVLLADSEHEALVALNTAREESRWQPWARNDRCAGDTPLICCGVGQIASPPGHGSSCARLGALEVEGWTLMLSILRTSARTWTECSTV